MEKKLKILNPQQTYELFYFLNLLNCNIRIQNPNIWINIFFQMTPRVSIQMTEVKDYRDFIPTCILNVQKLEICINIFRIKFQK